MVTKAKQPNYLKSIYTIPKREAPVKIWCFYKEPYKIGLATTTLTAIAISIILLLVMLVGGGGFVILCAVGIAFFLLFYGIIIGLVLLGLSGFSADGRLGLVTTAIGVYAAYSLYEYMITPFNRFLFGEGSWDASDTGIFDYAIWTFNQLSYPFFWSVEFVKMNWLPLLLVVVAPAVIVFTIAGLFVFSMYSLQGLERLVQYYYGIRFPCPVCGKKSEPAIYSCPECGKEHKVNLVPSVHGVFNHTCTNESCKAPLSTMMLLGRNRKIQRACPHDDCKTPLNDITGTDKHVALIGGRNAGKTCLLAQIAKYMVDNYNAKLPEQEQEKHYQQLVQLISQGEVPMQTQRVTSYRAFQLVYEKRLFPYHLHLYDIAGENFEHIFDSASYPFYQNLDAIIFLFDPYSISSFRNNNPPPSNMAYSSQEPFEVLQNLIQALEKYNSKSQIKKIRFNVVLVKTDAGYLDKLVIDTQNKETESQALERFIRETIGESAFIEQAKTVFNRTRYFQLSALGRTPDPQDRSPFVGKNIQDSIQSIYKSIGVTI